MGRLSLNFKQMAVWFCFVLFLQSIDIPLGGTMFWCGITLFALVEYLAYQRIIEKLKNEELKT